MSDIEDREAVGARSGAQGSERASAVRDLTAAEKAKGMHFILYAAAFGTTYYFATNGNVFTLFLKRLGADSTRIGVFQSIILIFAVVQVLVAGMIERVGKKKFIISGWLWATVFSAGYILVPSFARRYGSEAAVYFLMALVVPFSFFRHVAMTGWMPLVNDVVPTEVRGRFFGKMRTLWQCASITFLLFVAWFFGGEQNAPFWRYQVIFAIGIAASGIRIFAISRIPEIPPATVEETRPLLSTLNMPFKDRTFVRFLLFSCLVTMALATTDAFAVVYLKSDALSFGDSHALFASTVLFFAGSAASLILWGVLADRVGSKPLLVIATLGLGLARFLWLGVSDAETARFVVPVIFITYGVFSAGYGIANTKYLFGISPRRFGKTTYIVTNGVVVTLVSSAMVYLGGRIIDGMSYYRDTLLEYGLDEYRLPFVVSGAMTLIAAIVLVKLQERGTVPTRDVLAALVTRPVRASYNIFLFSRMLPEKRRVGVTKALGELKSVIGEEELLRALEDPSFQVRQAAVDALSRMKSRRAVKALIGKLADPYSFVRPGAAAALGEAGSASAVPALEEALVDSNSELRQQAALALAKIGCADAIDRLREAMVYETDPVVWAVMATAAAVLGDRTVIVEVTERLNPDAPAMIRAQLFIAASNAIGAEDVLYQYLHAGEGRFRESARDALTRIRSAAGAEAKGSAAESRLAAVEEGIADADYSLVVAACGQVAAGAFAECFPGKSASGKALAILAEKTAPLRWEGALLALVCLERLFSLNSGGGRS